MITSKILRIMKKDKSINEKISSTSAIDLAATIKRMRLAQNISQITIANNIGISLRTYQEFEKTGEIRLMKFIEILRMLGVFSKFTDAMKNLDAPTTIKEAENIAKRRVRARNKNLTENTPLLGLSLKEKANAEAQKHLEQSLLSHFKRNPPKDEYAKELNNIMLDTIKGKKPYLVLQDASKEKNDKNLSLKNIQRKSISKIQS